MVTAGAPVVPQDLIAQLNIGGKLVIPVGDDKTQVMLRIIRVSETEYEQEELDNFKFVPLIGEKGMEIENQQQSANQNADKTTIKEAPILTIKGFLMGSADIVPGVSGGTMALILDIYERLLNAIKSVDVKFVKSLFRFNLKEAFGELHWLFLVALFTGIFSAAVFFTKVVPLQIYMFTHPEIVYGLFFGLIVGSIYILIKEQSQFRWQEGVFLLAGLGIGLWIVNLVPTDTPDHPAFVF